AAFLLYAYTTTPGQSSVTKEILSWETDFEAAKKIKKISPNSLCPLIFITSLDSDQAFIDSIDAGGDGILVRPFSPQVFKAKIKSIQRISDLYSQIKKLQQEQQKDAELAEELMSGVIESRNYGLDKISIVKKAAALFSGDIQLTVLCPNGDINILLGDFTGHGLRSSIGAIPLSETFRAMTKKGFSLIDIINQINSQLYDLLPIDLFLCATFVTLSGHEKSAYLFNAGLPDAYIFDEQGKIEHQFASSHPPLGVLPHLLPNSRLTIVPIEPKERIVLISDGIIEAGNDSGELYGIKRFEEAAKEGIVAKDLASILMADIDKFCAGKAQEDDISLIDIPCGGWQRQINVTAKADTVSHSSLEAAYQTTSPDWQWNLKLVGKSLAAVNPVPMIMNQINDIEGSGEHWQSLYTILTELFVNALDHGVLKLSSTLKQSAEGFTQYFNEREKRLQNLDYGFIDISLNYFSLAEGGKVVITLKDSGDGFDSLKLFKNNTALEEQDIGQMLSGRGIELVNQLSDTLEFQENGTLVEAVYIWQNKKS
ncbi:MAG: SpoIIE family protein phosphatase, partial [Colwellia sp.]|nr:SpoIIE family protein phosphatase [Colwellia sp.]